MKRIPIAGPWITQKEVDYAADAAANSWYDNAGVYNDRFEKAFREYIGVKHAISLPHCTAAIHLSLLALGVGPGDEVIVPDVTWIATAAPISYVGATPVFADIHPNSWCLSAEAFERSITPRTKAVIPVDLYGGVPDWDAILDVARRHSVAIVEDAAEAIGSEYKGRKAGSFGDTGVFSFHGSKTLTTGEGGMLVTNREDILERVLFLRDHGRAPGDQLFQNTEVAFKYKMSSLQAAVGLAQLERVDDLVNRKRQIFEWYRCQLQGVDGVTLNAQPDGTKNSYWMVTVALDPHLGWTNKSLSEELSGHGVDSRPFFHPLSSLPAYDGLPQAAEAKNRNRIAYEISPYALNLPSALNLTKQQVIYVCDALKQVL